MRGSSSARRGLSLISMHKWGLFEAEFQGDSICTDPLRDITLNCNFASPSGRKIVVEAFWDGESTWRVRFMPDEIGAWTYRTTCSNEHDKGLHDRVGRFESVPYQGDNPVYVHGPLRLSHSRRYLVHADNAPFFWLADTAWNGIIMATPDEWSEYLSFRREQCFTAVQFVMTHWRAGPCDIEGEKAYEGKERIVKINADFFRRIDPKFSMLNEYGLVAAPVLLWDLGDSPGVNLVEDDAILLARYLIARYGARILVWILAGDGDYRGEKAERWKRIGRAVFLNRHRQLVTIHPGGKHWNLPEFLHEDWLDIVGYQSGHGVDEDDLKWLCFGPPSKDWRLEPRRPAINLEPNYEEHLAYRISKPITPHMVRRAAYWSLLAAPSAGVSYGTNGVWYWARKPEVPLDHPHVGIAKPWREAIRLSGAEDMGRLRRLFSQVPWWVLVPDPELLAEQPGLKNVRLFTAASRSENGKTAVVYRPEEQDLDLNLAHLQKPLEVLWVNPRTGEETNVGSVSTDHVRLRTPGPGDWLLILKSTI